jgi:ubiquitin carboxyl-terminal hydrolase 14
VKFSAELDALDLATDELKEKLLPASRRLKEIEKERAERRKVRKRTKVNAAAPSGEGKQDDRIRDVEMRDAVDSTSSSAPGVEVTSAVVTGGDAETGDGVDVPAGELADEAVYRAKEIAELTKLVDPDAQNDVGCSVTGLYELVGELSDSS